MDANLSADHFERALRVEVGAAQSAARHGDDRILALAVEGIDNVSAELERLGVPVDRDWAAPFRGAGS